MRDAIPSAFLRLFIALAIPPEVRREIARFQGQLQRVAPPNAIRWTRPDQFHVTLKYLGDVPSDQIVALEKAVATVCAGCPALKITARGAGFFPNIKRPRVIWTGIADERGQLAELHRQFALALQPFAPADQTERFAGHITLGRFKPGRYAAVEKLRERVTDLRTRDFGGWLVGEVEIFRSELTATGALHTPLSVCPLARAE